MKREFSEDIHGGEPNWETPCAGGIPGRISSDFFEEISGESNGFISVYLWRNVNEFLIESEEKFPKVSLEKVLNEFLTKHIEIYQEEIMREFLYEFLG